MPSGAKKRKAAKKKKENNSSLSHGDDDVRRHDDQESVAATERIDIKVGALSNNKDGKVEIHEPNGKSCNGVSPESSSYDNSDDESRVLKNGPAVSSNAPFVDSLSETLDKDIHSSVKDEFDMSSTVDKYVPSYVINSVFKENGVKFVEDKVGNSAAAPEMKVDVQSVKNTAFLDATEHLLPERNNNSTLLPNGVEHVKDSRVTEPLLSPSQQAVEQKTSWKGCCGLFEVLMGSGR